MANEAVFLPVLPSFDGFFKDLSKGAKQGGDQAGRDMAAAMEKSLKQAERQVDTLGKAQERAQNRAADAADKTRVAQLKLAEAMDDSSVSSSKLADLTAKYEKAQRDESTATKAAERADKDLTKAQNDLQKATDQAGDSVEMTTAEIDRMSESMDSAGEKSKGLGDKLMSGLGKIGTGALLGVGAKIGATVTEGIGTAFSKGFGRLQSIEQAETMLSGLGNSAAEVESIMDSAMESVSGTAYGFGEAASMAATFSGAGIKDATELTRILSLVGDTASITGADFNEMGSIWTKVATGQKLQTAEMNQLMDRGLGVLPELQKHYGVTADEARKMVTEGKVSFEDFSEVMENMVGGSAQAMGDTFSGSAANMQAALGRLGAKFLEPVYANAPAVFQAIGGAVDKLGEHLSPLIADFSEKLAPYMEDFAERLGPALEKSIDNIANGFKASVEWIRENSEWLKALAVSVGTAVTAWKLWTLGIKAHNTAVLIGEKGWKAYIASTKIATAVTKLFNKATKANVIGLIVTALAALVAGLVYFFTKTETGRAIWDKFTTALGDGWDWVVEKVSAGWEWLQTNVFTPLMDFVTGTLQPIWESVVGGIASAWDGLVTGIQWAWDTIFQPVLSGLWQLVQITLGVIGTLILAPLLLAWEALSSGIQWWWENVTKPVFEAISTFAMETLWPILQSSFQWIMDKWQSLSNLFGAVWGWLQTNVFTPLVTFVTATLWPIIQSAFQWIMDKWNAVYTTFQSVWAWIRDTVFTPLTTFVTGTLWPILQSAFQWIIDKWDALGDGFNIVKNFVVDTVFAGFQTGLSALKDFISNIVDGIGKVWNGLKSLLAKPINFMIGTVYNDGILTAWNIIAGILPGLETGSRLSKIPEHATGGRISGPGTGTSDDVLMWGSNGEHMLTAREVQEMGGHGAVYAMRDAVQAGKPFTFDGQGGLAILPKVDERAGDLAGAAPGLLIPGFAEGGAIRPMWEIQLENGHRAAQMRHGNPYTWGHEDCSGYMSMIADAIINGGNGIRKWATSSFPGGQPWVPGLGPGFSVGVHDNPGGPGGGHTAGTLTGVGPYMTTNVESGGSPSMVKYGVGAAGADSPQFRGVHPGQFHLAIGADGAFESGGSVDPAALRGWISDKLGGVVDTIMDPLVSLLPEKPPEWQGIPRGVYDVGRDGLVETIATGVAGLTDGLATVWNAVRNIPDLISAALTGGDDINDAAGEGYHKGGLAPAGRGFMAKTAMEPEMVLNPAMTRAFINWMNVSPESLNVMGREIFDAFHGGDWGYGELAYNLGSPEVAKAIVDGAASLGELSRAAAPILADAGKDYATSALDLVGLGGLVEIADGVVAKVGEITSDEEFQEAVKKVQLDPDGMYSGREIARKLEELGLDVEEIKSRMGGSLLGGITAMA